MNAATFVQARGQSIFSSTLCQLVLYTSPGPHTAQGSLVLEKEDLKPKRSFTQTSSKPGASIYLWKEDTGPGCISRLAGGGGFHNAGKETSLFLGAVEIWRLASAPKQTVPPGGVGQLSTVAAGHGALGAVTSLAEASLAPGAGPTSPAQVCLSLGALRVSFTGRPSPRVLVCGTRWNMLVAVPQPSPLI